MSFRRPTERAMAVRLRRSTESISRSSTTSFRSSRSIVLMMACLRFTVSSCPLGVPLASSCGCYMALVLLWCLDSGLGGSYRNSLGGQIGNSEPGRGTGDPWQLGDCEDRGVFCNIAMFLIVLTTRSNFFTILAQKVSLLLALDTSRTSSDVPGGPSTGSVSAQNLRFQNILSSFS